MAETINIAKMAEKLSKEIFAEFLWKRMTPTNINWPCESQDAHKVKTHPSDVVFYYDEPYTQARTYINTDLKSYAKGSITVGAIRSAIESLARSLGCAETSEEFRTKFLHEHVSPDICGLLFVYNHDGEYDKDFSGLLGQIKNEKLDIPTKSKIVVFGPRDIFWLNNVHHEIAYMRGGGGILPDREHCKYFYPHLVRRKNVQLEHATAATLEMLTAPWIILSYINPKKQNRKGFVIFYRKRGESVEEFLYLIDNLMHYQVLVDETDIYIKTLDAHPNAAAFFDKAKDQYVEEYEGGSDIRDRLNTIVFAQINDVRTKFSEAELSRQDV
ncbi:MAG: hypothetical protein Q8M05_16370 [Rhodoferax sp.]|uniref:hypothetical protein n=1 Tax=Rhodoferax sp. TaxID=50421 RepID=UPI00272FC063|nr:hypothetical protein [Rhodoferax sp.]MDP1530953.1 hypothetical protein [Rhodoferax sp.]MDP1942581.1 hypothetical protein [Rhodoferax sp.]MDP3865278.1 hypothetical protein [Rhodoferax sp.]